MWDFSIQTKTKIDHNKPDLILLEKKEICHVVDVASRFDPPIEKKERNKIKNEWFMEESGNQGLHCSSCNLFLRDGLEKCKQIYRGIWVI